MRDFLLLALITTCCALAVRRPFVGILCYVGLGLFSPHSYGWGFARDIPMAQLVVGATFLGMVLFKPHIKFPREREVKFLLGLFLVFSMSTFFALSPDNAWHKMIEISKISLMVVVILLLINTKEQLWWLLRVMALCIGFYGLKGGVWSIFTGGQDLVYGPEESFLHANNAIGLAMTMNLPILFYLFRVETNWWLKYIFLVMFIFSYPAIICTYSRGAWLGMVTATFLILWYTRYKVFWLLSGGLAALVLVASMLALNLVPETITKRFDQLVHYEEEGSAQSRLWSWEFCRRVGFSNPITGAGFNYYSRGMYAKYYPEFLKRYKGKGTYWSCHSMWFTVFSEQGFIGMALWLSLLGSCFLGLRKVGRIAKSLNNQVLYLFSRMLVSVVLVYMVVGTFLDVAYFEFFFQIVAAIICLKSIVKMTRRTQENDNQVGANSTLEFSR